MLISSLRLSLVLLVKSLCSLRVLKAEGQVTNLTLQEILVTGEIRLLGIKSELLIATKRVVSEVVPVTSLECKLLLSHSLRHALLDAVVDTRCVCNDQRWSWICLSLCNSLYSLLHVAAHVDMSYIYIAIGHCDTRKILLAGLLTTCSELCNCTGRSRLGGLSTCVGVNLSIEYHYVDVLAGSKYMIEAAETDIISPTITTEDPLALLSEEVLILYEILGKIIGLISKCCNELIRSCTVGSAYSESIKPLLSYILYRCILLSELLHFLLQSGTDCVLSK